MECLRCNADMKQYKLNNVFNVYGRWHREIGYATEIQKPHNPQSIFVCDECGYCELSLKECNEPDI